MHRRLKAGQPARATKFYLWLSIPTSTRQKRGGIEQTPRDACSSAVVHFAALSADCWVSATPAGFGVVLRERIELSTSPLPRECSTTELPQRNHLSQQGKRPFPCSSPTRRRRIPAIHSRRRGEAPRVADSFPQRNALWKTNYARPYRCRIPKNSPPATDVAHGTLGPDPSIRTPAVKRIPASASRRNWSGRRSVPVQDPTRAPAAPPVERDMEELRSWPQRRGGQKCDGRGVEPPRPPVSD